MFLAGCTGEEKTGDTTLYPNGLGDFEFHVVQIRREYGISTWNDYVVTCRSPFTLDAPRQKKDLVPHGSVLMGRISYIDSAGGKGNTEFDQIANVAFRSIAHGPGWVAWTHKQFRISRDNCVTWIEIDPPGQISPNLVLKSQDGDLCDSPGCAKILLHNHGVTFRDVKIERGARPGRDRVSLVMLSTALVSRGGLALVTEDGGASWTVTPRAEGEAGDAFATFKPDPSRYLEDKPAPPPKPLPPYALTDEEIAAIPPPPRGSFDRGKWVEGVHRSAKRGDRLGVRQASYPTVLVRPGDELDLYRQAVLAAMLAKGPKEDASRDAAKRTDENREARVQPAPPPSPYALTETELDAIPVPKAGDLTPALVEKIRGSAKAGERLDARLATIPGLTPRPGDEIDLYRRAVYDAMVAKAAQGNRPRKP